MSAGTSGSPVLLVHGFPETSQVFHRLLPLLAERHRVVAVDLRGFGDSSPADERHDAAAAAGRPDLVASWTGIETGLPGFGWEALADVAHGGAWHIGALAAPGIPELLLAGRERAFLTGYALPSMTGTPGAFGDDDIEALVRAYAGPAGFSGAAALFRAALREGDELRTLGTVGVPVLAVGGGSGPFTADTLRHVAPELREVTIAGIGHFVAMEAPGRLAEALLDFFATVDV